jgi:hypothetical protein
MPLGSDSAAQSSEELKFNLPANQVYPLTIPFSLVRSGIEDMPKEVKLTLTEFTGAQKDSLRVVLDNQQPPGENCTSGGLPYPATVPISETGTVFLRIILTVQCNPPTPGPYVGKLYITSDGYAPLVIQIPLTKAVLRPAVLTLARKGRNNRCYALAV